MSAAPDPGARSGRLLALCALSAVVLLVAGLTHFLAILLMPEVATQDAYSVLASKFPPAKFPAERTGATDRLVLLPPSRPGDAPIPFRDPATVQGLCFYDVAKAPVRVRVTVEPGRLLTLSFRTREGRVFYSMTDRAALKGQIDIRLVDEAQLKDIEDADDQDDGLPSELRLKVPSPRGLMVATALVARPAEARDATREIASITCAPEPLPPPS